MNTTTRFPSRLTYTSQSPTTRAWFERAEPEKITEEQFCESLVEGIQQGDIFCRNEGVYRSRVVQGEAGRQFRVECVGYDVSQKPIAYRLYRLNVDQQGVVQEEPIVNAEGRHKIMTTKDVFSYLLNEGNKSQETPLPLPDAYDDFCAKRPLSLRGLRPSSPVRT